MFPLIPVEVRRAKECSARCAYTRGESSCQFTYIVDSSGCSRLALEFSFIGRRCFNRCSSRCSNRCYSRCFNRCSDRFAFSRCFSRCSSRCFSRCYMLRPKRRRNSCLTGVFFSRMFFCCFCFLCFWCCAADFHFLLLFCCNAQK